MPMPKLTLKDLRDGGYLQEVNRQFFHPLGMALALEYPDGSDPENLPEPTGVCVYDYRDDEEGMYFAAARNVIDASRRMEFAGKIEHEREQKMEKRKELFGGDSVVQSIESLIQIIAKPDAEAATE